MTPSRLAYLQDLDAKGIGEPSHRAGSPHHACVSLGWIEAVYRYADGRVISQSELDLTHPDGTPGRWKGLVGLVGLQLTMEGRKAMQESMQDATKSVDSSKAHNGFKKSLR